MPGTIAGCLHPSNCRHVLDWNAKGVLAYGCHNLIFIVDGFTRQRVQSVDLHKSAINNIAWAPAGALGLQSKSDVLLASADISGEIIVCDPYTATQQSRFSLASSGVQAMQWFVWKDISRDFLLVLHSGSSLVLWNTDTGEKVWTFQYHISLFDFSLDPFNSKRAAFSTAGSSILLVSDLNLNAPPTSTGHLIKITNDEGSKKTTNVSVIKHHSAYKNILFVGIGTMIYAVETELHCILTKVSTEGTLCSLLPTSHRDALFSISTMASIQLRIGSFTSNEDRADTQMTYEKIVSSDPQRSSAHVRVVSAALCPVTQTNLALLYNNGRIVFWQLDSGQDSVGGLYRTSFIEDFLQFDESLDTKAKSALRLRQSAVCGALTSNVACVRVRPLEDLEGESESDPLSGMHIAAIGTHSGSVYLVDIFASRIVKEFNVQSSPVRCIEWASPHSVITAGYNHTLSTSQLVRNDVFITDIRTGISHRVRPDNDETPITILRVSFYRSYMAIAFQKEPLEIWDIKNMRLLRKMSRACPLIIDMAWSCKHCTVKTTEQSGHPVYRENLVVVDSDNRLYHIVVKGLHVRDGKEVNTQWKSGGWSIRCMTWKDDILVMGDADGRIAVWDLQKKQNRQTRVGRSPVLRMQFSRLAGDHTLAVLQQRDVCLYDTDTLTKTHSIQLDGSIAALDMDLCGVSPILVTNDNMMRYAPTVISNAPMSDRDIPMLMKSSECSRIAEDFRKAQRSETTEVDCMIKRSEKSDVSKGSLLSLKREQLLHRWLGDLHTADLIQIVLSSSSATASQISPHLQMFWPNKQFKERELRIVCACCRLADALESRLVERAVVLGGKARDRAVDRLVGSGSGDLRIDSLKAALLVSDHSGEQAKSLIKLIATNLIANDMIEDGVEMLFLVGAGVDACKYLQSQRQWNKSVTYAKMGLDDTEEVLQKWITHLHSDQKSRCVMSLAAMKDWPATVEMLSSMGCSELARAILKASTEIATSEAVTNEKEDSISSSGKEIMFE